jgi:hypothetical protein
MRNQESSDWSSDVCSSDLDAQQKHAAFASTEPAC